MTKTSLESVEYLIDSLPGTGTTEIRNGLKELKFLIKRDHTCLDDLKAKNEELLFERRAEQTKIEQLEKEKEEMIKKTKQLESENYDLIKSIEKLKECVESDEIRERVTEKDIFQSVGTRKFNQKGRNGKYFSLQELRQLSEDFLCQEENYRARRKRKVKTEIWENHDDIQFIRNRMKSYKGHSMNRINLIKSNDKIREEMIKEKEKRRIIIDNSIFAIEKIKAKLELQRLRNRGIIERKIKRISELERKVDEYMNEARELRSEKEEALKKLKDCQEEINTLKSEKMFNTDDLAKYKNHFMDRFIIYNYITKDLTILEEKLRKQCLCFSRCKKERTMINRMKELLTDGLIINSVKINSMDDDAQ